MNQLAETMQKEGVRKAKIAFYAPLKPLSDPRPSGDRTMARLLRRALGRAGYSVMVASRLKSRDGTGDATRQQRIRSRAEARAASLCAVLRHAPPNLWLTYHLQHKAPDWIGPWVSRRLNIPYVVVEGSFAPKRQGGPWDMGHRAVHDALSHADLILQPNPEDKICVAPLLKPEARMRDFPAFLDTAPFVRWRKQRDVGRRDIARRYAMPESAVWLFTAAMMRPGDKASSYAVLAAALARLPEGSDWRLMIAGDGPAESTVRECFRNLSRVRFAGRLSPAALGRMAAACDLFLWPGIREAYGFALLEAQAAGLPAVVANRPGVRAIVRANESAILIPEGDVRALAGATAQLIADPDRRAAMAQAAMVNVDTQHGLDGAAMRLRAELEPLLTRRKAMPITGRTLSDDAPSYNAVGRP